MTIRVCMFFTVNQFLFRWKNVDEKMDILSFDGIDVEIRTVEKTQIPLNGDLVQCIGEMTEEVSKPRKS